MLCVEIFDEEHEKDLQININKFLSEINENDIIDIKYSINAFVSSNGEQIYCYSALIIYRIYK
jgi:hypothetical protein